MSIPCSAAQSSAGHGRSANDEHDRRRRARRAPPRRGAPAGCCRRPRRRPRSGRSRERQPSRVAGALRAGRPARPRRRASPRRRSPRSEAIVASIAAGATTTTIPRPPLNVARTSSSSSPPSAPTSRITDGIRHRVGSSRAPRPVRQRARDVARQAAAGDVGDAAQVVAGREERRRQGEDRAGVDPRRRQQHLAERRQGVLRLRAASPRPSRPRPSVRVSCSWYGRSSGRSQRASEAADEREAVRVEPGRRRARRSRRRPAPRCRRSAGRRSTMPRHSPARSNALGSIRPGCSAVSPPTSAQPASRQPAATPATSPAGLRRVEPADGDVVEEDQRLGAGADDVVGAHRDEVDADRVPAPERGGDRGLRARRRRSRRRSPARGSRPGS